MQNEIIEQNPLSYLILILFLYIFETLKSLQGHQSGSSQNQQQQQAAVMAHHQQIAAAAAAAAAAAEHAQLTGGLSTAGAENYAAAQMAAHAAQIAAQVI